VNQSNRGWRKNQMIGDYEVKRCHYILARSFATPWPIFTISHYQ